MLVCTPTNDIHNSFVGRVGQCDNHLICTQRLRKFPKSVSCPKNGQADHTSVVYCTIIVHKSNRIIGKPVVGLETFNNPTSLWSRSDYNDLPDPDPPPKKKEVDLIDDKSVKRQSKDCNESSHDDHKSRELEAQIGGFLISTMEKQDDNNKDGGHAYGLDHNVEIIHYFQRAIESICPTIQQSEQGRDIPDKKEISVGFCWDFNYGL
jgi:hypothetical protein